MNLPKPLLKLNRRKKNKQMNETELLFTKVLNCSRNSLYLHNGAALDREKQLFISSVLKRRIKGEPIQYILGESEFMGLPFKVTRDVLIPRPETEILIETVLKYGPQKILELGTGTGCIAVSLAKFIPSVRIVALDISKGALIVAVENAERNGVLDKIEFKLFDLLADNREFHKVQIGNFDLIVSNPPYIRSSQIHGLAPEIQFEPRVALDGGEDGLDFYRKIIKNASSYLNKNGYLILEMGFGQCAKIRKILQNSLNFEIIEVVKDYSNIDRVIVSKNR